MTIVDMPMMSVNRQVQGGTLLIPTRLLAISGCAITELTCLHQENRYGLHDHGPLPLEGENAVSNDIVHLTFC